MTKRVSDGTISYSQRLIWYNSRTYIVAAAVLASIAVLAWLRLHTISDQLWVIQCQQYYGFIAIGLLYATLIISPIRSMIGDTRLRRLLYARRGFGLSACYFALLHAILALWGQLGGLGATSLLPPLFQWSLLGGAIALGILCIMACTPSDQLVPRLPYRWWKRIHRLVYIAGVLIIFHVWAIGTHLIAPSGQLIACGALMVLLGLESFRFTRYLSHKFSYFGRVEAAILSIILWIIIGLFLVLLPAKGAFAHTMITDTSGKEGAVLHIDPADNPIAGQQSTIYLDTPLRGSITLTVQGANTLDTVTMQRDNSVARAGYTFPSQGVYYLTFQVQSYQFRQAQLVTRGAITQAAATPYYPWATALLVASSIGFGVLAVAALANYRRIIATSTY